MALVCCFFGHRNIFADIEPALSREVERLITDEGVDTFYFGGYGDFDWMASGVLKEMKEKYPHIDISLILAYMPGKKDEYDDIPKHYDTLFPEGLEEGPRRFAISKRNKWIVENSDYIIAYVRSGYGGAYDALKLAARRKKVIINLADSDKQ